MSVALEDLRVVRDRFVLEVDARLEGGCTAVLGPSGSGKTTLLEAVAGLVRPQRGRVVVDGAAWSDAGSGAFVAARRRHVGYVPQDGALFPHLSVRGNLLYGVRAGEPAVERIVALLRLGDLLHRRVPTLSGGERRRVALGRALATSPRLLLLDEPTTGLDAALRSAAHELIRLVRQELAIPVLLVTHDDAEAAALATQVLRLDAGRAVS